MSLNDIMISANFRLSEFASRDTGEVMIYPELVTKTQRVRDLIGLPVRINSGYRTPERNRQVGGVPNSLHCQGKAVDLSCAFCSLAQLTVAAIWARFTGVIVYNLQNFVHCDLRDERAYLVPADWVEFLRILFPEFKNNINAWSGVQNVSGVEV